MDIKLQNKIISIIYNIYPLSEKDCIVLTGSRAYWFATEYSDVDIMIFTNNKKYYERTSVEKWFRRKWEEAWLEYRIDKKILLEVKIKGYRLDEFKINPMLVYWITNCNTLTNKLDFKKIKKFVKKRFTKNYEKILMWEYINFWNEFKQMDWMIRREDKDSKINLKIQKWIVVQAIMRLWLIAQKKPYPTNKRLYHEVSKSKLWKDIAEFWNRIFAIKSFNQLQILKKEIKDFCKEHMPNRNYVSTRWTFLDEFYKIKMY